MHRKVNENRWESFYRDHDIATMPWFYPSLDPDLASGLKAQAIESGKILDVGTGPGTQAIALADLGFEVTAIDISVASIEKAKQLARERMVKVDFRRDDILNSRLIGSFVAIIDRGCFHVIDPDQRIDYVHEVHSLLKPGGTLFLKCFSDQEPGEDGPYRFAPEEINDYFGRRFEFVDFTETIYYGTLNPAPKALFCIFERK